MEENIQHKGWFGRNWKWVVPTGCGLILIIVVIAMIGGLFWGVTSLIQENEGYAYALEKVSENTIVVEALGEPIETTGILQGKLHTSNGNSSLDIMVPIKGPKGNGRLIVVGSEEDNKWTYNRMEVKLYEPDRTVNLLEPDQ